MLEGIRSRRPQLPVQIIANESEAILYALDNAIEKELVVVLCDKIQDVLKLINNYKETVLFSNPELTLKNAEG